MYKKILPYELFEYYGDGRRGHYYDYHEDEEEESVEDMYDLNPKFNDSSDSYKYPYYDDSKDTGDNMIYPLNEHQIHFLDTHTERAWRYNKKTNRIDIYGNFEKNSSGPDNFLGICFGEVKGDFTFSQGKLKNLKGAPISIEGEFNCSFNELTTLEGGPKFVDSGVYDCYNNKLVNLDFLPNNKLSYLDAADNLLKNVSNIGKFLHDGWFREGLTLNLSNNLLEEIPTTTNVENYFLKNNNLTSLKNLPRLVSHLYIEGNPIDFRTGKGKEIGVINLGNGDKIKSLEGIEGILCYKITFRNYSHSLIRKHNLEYEIDYLDIIKNLDKNPLLYTLITPEIIQKLIDVGQEKAIIDLKDNWNKIKKLPGFNKIKFKDGYKDIIDALGELGDFGL